MNPLLSVENLTIKYKSAAAPAVRGLSFSMNEGENLALYGPSGTGKSTVVWALMGMLGVYQASASGIIHFQDDVVDLELRTEGLRRSWREISLIPQSSMSALNPIQTVGQSMMEMMDAHEGKGDRKLRKELCAELLCSVLLDRDVINAYPYELSGGMAQRVSIAMAIMYHPKLLIMDEATTGLDILTEADILGLIRSLQKKENMSILMISHDRRLLDAFCDRRIEMGDGCG